MPRLLLRSWCLVVVGCLLPGPSARAQSALPLSPEQIARIDGAVASTMAEHGVVGLQVAVGIDREVVWSAGYGTADVEHDVPVKDDTRFRTASISKWMTATAAMRLVERGLLDLDEPIQKYCPQYSVKPWTVTSRHLLTHRAGIRHYRGENDEPRATAAEREELARAEAEERLGFAIRYTDVVAPLDRFKDDALLFEPGTRFHYSSHGYRVLGCVLQGAAGRPYRELMGDLVFVPAGMTRTRDDDAHAVTPGRARGYTRADDGALRRSDFRDVSENLPAGGHVSTATDLVRFALAFHNGVLIGQESRRRMTARPQGSDEGEHYYGFGLNVVTRALGDGETEWWHRGTQAESRTLLWLSPTFGVAIAIMTNYEPFEPAPLLDALIDLVLP